MADLHNVCARRVALHPRASQPHYNNSKVPEQSIKSGGWALSYECRRKKKKGLLC